MLDPSQELQERALVYATARGIELKQFLGEGTRRRVWPFFMANQTIAPENQSRDRQEATGVISALSHGSLPDGRGSDRPDLP
ncbi:MAG: hypothetical protein FWD61_20255 [Phycisphaerales bacterium]|nr:hypothetical protein [Phycisphaerales bacterium]